MPPLTGRRLDGRSAPESIQGSFIDYTDIEDANIFFDSVWLGVVDSWFWVKLSFHVTLLPDYFDSIFWQLLCMNNTSIILITVQLWDMLWSIDDCVVIRVWEIRLQGCPAAIRMDSSIMTTDKFLRIQGYKNFSIIDLQAWAIPVIVSNNNESSDFAEGPPTKPCHADMRVVLCACSLRFYSGRLRPKHHENPPFSPKFMWFSIRNDTISLTCCHSGIQRTQLHDLRGTYLSQVPPCQHHQMLSWFFSKQIPHGKHYQM